MNHGNDNNHKLSLAALSMPPKNNNILESGALFRSVSMGLSLSPPLHSPAVGTLLKSHSSPYPEEMSSTEVPTIPTTSEEWVWKLSEHQLSAVPPYHPLERTAVLISDIPSQEITVRISNFLKQHSILANYNANRVLCMTDDLLKFVIQLWQSPKGVIVEVQRRQGCCIAMQTIRHHLLEAIQSATRVKSTMPPVAPPSRSTCGIVQSLVEKVQLPTSPQNEFSCASALELAKRLLQSHRLDEQRLGLESLCSLTNPSHVLLRDADTVSRTILLEPNWQILIGRYFHYRGTELCEEKDDFGDALHMLALKTVTQAIEALAASHKSIDVSTPFWSRLLEDLFENLTMASNRPLEASWSTRCFRHMQLVQPQLLHWIPNYSSLHIHLVQAHDYGKQHHRSLQMETEQWMGRLGYAY